MRKLFLMTMAVCAMTFASCGNKAAQSENAEATEVADSLNDATTELAAQLAAGDVNKFQEALTAAQAKVAELLENNPEQAQAYLEKVQNYLKENAEQVKSLVGDNEIVSATVNTLVETPAQSIINNLKSVVSTTEDAANAAVQNANDQVDAAKQAAQDKVDAAKQAAQDKVDAAKQAAQDKVDAAKQAAADKVNEGANKVNEKVNEGANKLLKGAGLK
ncbi:MAG: hypothetical protein J6I52_11335 [Prevotella sp.]|nr:hypothetical protein [Prevotella sp.]